MATPSVQPKILFVTPEAVFIPDSPDYNTGYLNAKMHTGGPAQNLANLMSHLIDLGIDVHVAQPDYRKIFAVLLQDKRSAADSMIPGSRIHLAEDRLFFYSNPIDSNCDWENTNIALAFQREVGNQIVPRIQPDLIHCHDWMTGLIPAMAKHWGIPCLFTVRSLRSAKSPLSRIEDSGIDGAAFWQHLFYDRYPGNYEETRDTNPLDFLLSGILAAHHVSTAGPALMPEIFEGLSEFYYSPLRHVLAQKWNAGCACAIPGSCNPSFSPARHEKLLAGYGSNDQEVGKQNKNPVRRQRPYSIDDRSTAQRYIELYETILQRPMATPEHKKASKIKKDSHTKISCGQAILYRKARSTQLDLLPNERILTPPMAPI